MANVNIRFLLSVCVVVAVVAAPGAASVVHAESLATGDETSLVEPTEGESGPPPDSLDSPDRSGTAGDDEATPADDEDTRTPGDGGVTSARDERTAESNSELAAAGDGAPATFDGGSERASTAPEAATPAVATRA
jgi:hypothetical protein